jgi:hypothetical protein
MKKIISIVLILAFVPTYVFPFECFIPNIEGIDVKEVKTHYIEFTYLNLNYKCNYENSKIVAVIEEDNELVSEITICENGIEIYPNDTVDSLCVLIFLPWLTGLLLCGYYPSLPPDITALGCLIGVFSLLGVRACITIF